MSGNSTDTIVLGLTGSIAMGKSTVLDMFAETGIPTFNADTAVHTLYARGGEAVAPVAVRFPDSLVEGAIDREALAAIVLNDPLALKELETIVHPLVRQAQSAFIDQARAGQVPLVVVEIPLLFETGAETRLDATAVVSAPKATQRARVLARPGMGEEKLQAILGRQMPDAEKRSRADYVIDTGQSLRATGKDVEKLVAHLAPTPSKQ